MCPGVNKAGIKHARSSCVAEQIQEIIRNEPNMSFKQINSNLENMYGILLPYIKIWRSRDLTRDDTFGLIDYSNKLVLALKKELIEKESWFSYHMYL